MATTPVCENGLPLQLASQRPNGKLAEQDLGIAAAEDDIAFLEHGSAPHLSQAVICGVTAMRGSLPSLRASVAAGPHGFPWKPRRVRGDR